VAIFKVWKWAQNQKGTIALKTAWERFRKDRRGKITQTELSWSLEQLAAIELIDYLEPEHPGNSGTVSERTEP
jgi:hypothetical protein